MDFKIDAILDTVGMLCPIPVYLTSKKINALKRGEILEIISDDEGILSDMPAWCQVTGNEVLKSVQSRNQYHFYIRKLS